MQRQGTSVLNPEYFQDITDQINRVDLCSDLQKLADKLTASIQAHLDGVEEQAAKIRPIVALASLALTDLPSVITFLEGLVAAQIEPYVAPYLSAIETVAQTVSAMAGVVTALENAAARLQSCSVTVAGLRVPVIPPLP